MGRLRADLAGGRGEIVARHPGRASGERGEQHDPEGVEVGGRAGFAAFQDFGGQEGEGPDQRTRRRQISPQCGPGDGEVGDLQLLGLREQDVRWLQIPVDHPGAVGVRQGLADIGADGGDPGRGQRSAFCEEARERPAAQVLHNRVGGLVVVPGVIDRSNVGVDERPRREALPAELRAEHLVREEVAVEDFDGDLSFQDLVDRPPDNRHPSGANLALQSVPAGEPDVDHRPSLAVSPAGPPQRDRRRDPRTAACRAPRQERPSPGGEPRCAPTRRG